jgi:hypothetical protein
MLDQNDGLVCASDKGSGDVVDEPQMLCDELLGVAADDEGILDPEPV